jgi:hypothetical protein
MVGKIGIAVCVLAAIVLYGTGKTVLFWLAIASSVILFSTGFLMSYIVARPDMKSFREAVRQMELDGATKEEIIGFMNSPMEETAEYDYKDVPNWIPAIALVSQLAGIVLLITGIIIRF